MNQEIITPPIEKRTVIMTEQENNHQQAKKSKKSGVAIDFSETTLKMLAYREWLFNKHIPDLKKYPIEEEKALRDKKDKMAHACLLTKHDYILYYVIRDDGEYESLHEELKKYQ